MRDKTQMRHKDKCFTREEAAWPREQLYAQRKIIKLKKATSSPLIASSRWPELVSLVY